MSPFFNTIKNIKYFLEDATGRPFQRYYFMKENVFLMQTPIEGGVCQKVLLMLASTDFLGDRNIHDRLSIVARRRSF